MFQTDWNKLKKKRLSLTFSVVYNSLWGDFNVKDSKGCALSAYLAFPYSANSVPR